MTTPKYAQLTRKLFSEGRPESAASPPSPETRASAIDAIEHAIAVDAQHYRRRRASAAIALAAGFAITASGGAAWLATNDAKPIVAVGASGAMANAVASNRAVLHLQGAGIEPLAQDNASTVADGSAIARGQRLVTRSTGRALLAFASGTEVALESKSDLTVVDDAATQRFSLASGTLSARVAKIAPGHRFIIGTGDSEIEVHGTSFRVSVVSSAPSCGEGATTRVEVFEGTVAVRHAGRESSVSAGERWPSGCAPTAVIAVSPPTTALAPEGQPPTSTPASSSSRLAEQNDLFAEAVAAKRRGATGTAIATFERFAATYPTSPLADSAMAERMKLLRTTDPARARLAARQYIERYPGGSARGIAQTILAESP